MDEALVFLSLMLERRLESFILLEAGFSLWLLDIFVWFFDMLILLLAGKSVVLRDDTEEIKEFGWEGENDFRSFCWELS